MNYKYPPKFQGDGHVKVVRSTDPVGTDCIAVTKAQARALVDNLYRDGRSVHSGRGSVLWVVLEALHYNMTRYVMVVYPGEGFEVRIERPEPAAEGEES